MPFLTAKHSLEYCLSYADKAHQSGFPALVVLGGDKSVGTPRSVEHAWQLRQHAAGRVTTRSRSADGRTRTRDPDRQVDYLASPSFHAEFFLTQVVSHHDLRAVERFLDAADAAE